MSARAWAWLVGLLLVGAGVFVVVLFVLQNGARESQLSLNLYFAAWELSQPVPVVALIGGAFAAGFVLAGSVFGVRALRHGRRVRQLEQEIALGSATGGGARNERAEWR